MAQGQTRYIEDAFEAYAPSVARALSRGMAGEPPLRIVVVSKNDWFSYPRYFQSNFFSLYYPTAQLKNKLADYDASENQIYLNIDTLPDRLPEEAGKEKDQRDVTLPRRNYMHEYAHAIDDLGSQQTCATPIGLFECGSASDDMDTLPYKAEWADRSSARILGNYFSIVQAGEPDEWFAAMTACKHDRYNKRRCESSDSSMAAYAASVERFIGSFSNMRKESWGSSWIPFSF